MSLNPTDERRPGAVVRIAAHHRRHPFGQYRDDEQAHAGAGHFIAAAAMELREQHVTAGRVDARSFVAAMQ